MRTAILRVLSMALAGLLVVLGIGSGPANAYEPPLAYVEGSVSAAPGTRFELLRAELTMLQATSTTASAAVGADGRFRIPFRGQTHGNVRIVGGDTGLANTWYGNSAKQEEAATIPLYGHGIRDINVAMAPGGSISGKVTLAPGSGTDMWTVLAQSTFTNPSGVQSVATTATATLASDGSYSIKGLAANGYKVSLVHRYGGWTDAWYGGVDESSATSVSVGTGANATGINIVVNKATISGTVSFPAGVTPEGGRVTAHSVTGHALATGFFGPGGTFTIPRVPSGQVKLSFGTNYASPLPESIWYPQAGSQAGAEVLTLAPNESRTGVVLQMQASGAVTGTVTGATGPVNVDLLDSAGGVVRSTTSDGAGAYSLTRLAAGTFNVRFGFDGISATSPQAVPQYYPGVPENLGQSAAGAVTVNAGGTSSGIDAQMTPGGSISGTILNDDGGTEPWLSVSAVSVNGSVTERRAVTDGAGRFTISGLADGDYILEANTNPQSSQMISYGRIYSGNVRDRQQASTISIHSGQSADAGTLSYATAGKTASPSSGTFVAVTPTRILDTRNTPGNVSAGINQPVQVAGVAGIPADASAVALNLTVTQPTAYGFVAAFPFGKPNPSTSNVNYSANQTVPNYVVVPIKDGKIMLGNEGFGSAQLIADVAGYFTGGLPISSGAYQAVAPFRAGDSRVNNGGTPGGQEFDVQIAGRPGLPAEVGAVVVNITAARTTFNNEPSGFGYLTAYETGTQRPGTSNLNYDYAAGDIPNLAIVPVSADGRITIANTSAKHVGIVVDVMGYFLKGAAATPGSFQSMEPKRFLDTRSNPAAVAGGQDVTVAVSGVDGVPAGARAVMANLTATQPSSYGFLTAYPTGQSVPNASNVNYSKDQTVANFAVVPIGADGKITIHNTSSGSVQVIVDVMGYIRG